MIPSSRLAWPIVRGRMRLQFVPHLVGEAGQRRVVDVLRQSEAFVAAIGFHVGRLPAQVDRIFGVDFELAGDLCVEFGEAGPDSRQVGDADIRI